MSWLLAMIGAAALLALALLMAHLGRSAARNRAATPPPAGRPEFPDPSRKVMVDRLSELERLQARGEITGTEYARRRRELEVGSGARASAARR